MWEVGEGCLVEMEGKGNDDGGVGGCGCGDCGGLGVRVRWLGLVGWRWGE